MNRIASASQIGRNSFREKKVSPLQTTKKEQELG
jgi:hypothetical protein